MSDNVGRSNTESYEESENRRLGIRPITPKENRLYEEGADRSPNYPVCRCYNRYQGGYPLHPTGGGPCYAGPDDQLGFEPRDLW